MHFWQSFITLGTAGFTLFAAPLSTNYQLPNYGFGSGGTSDATSSNYGLNATTGEVSNTQTSSTTYSAQSGQQNAQQSHVPTITLSNPANYYNRLKFVVDPGDNASDTLYSIAISTDNFVTTQYIQPDNTIASTRTISCYQSLAAWGGTGGSLVVGLASSTTYSVKVNAYQGRFTETEYGPASSAATAAPSITFDIDVATSDSETAPPYSVSFGGLLPATVTTAPDRLWIDLDTNALSGASIFIRSANAGLRSASNNFTLASASADLASAGSGYGAQLASATQSQGATLTATDTYNLSAQNVGLLASSGREVFSAVGPIYGGRGSLYLLAKSSPQTPAASDYSDVLTLTAAAAF